MSRGLIPPPPDYPPDVPAPAVPGDRADGSRSDEKPAVTGGLIPNWRKGETADLTPPAPPAPAAEEPAPADEQGEEVQEGEAVDEGQEDGQEAQEDATEAAAGQWWRGRLTSPSTPVPAPPAPAPPVAQPIADTTTAPGGADRIRPILFTAAAAGVGYAAGLVDAMGSFLPAAGQESAGTFALALAVTAGFGAWKFTGLPVVSSVLPSPMVSRVIVLAIAAEVARRAAPGCAQLLQQYGQPYGLGPAPVSLLLNVGAMCGGLYWVIDRNTRGWWWPTRWVARIPLASAILATALNARGITAR